MANLRHAQLGIAYCAFKCSDRRPMADVIKGFQGALEDVKRATRLTSIHPDAEFSVWSLKEGMKTALFGDERKIGKIILFMDIQETNLFIQSSFPNRTNSHAASDLRDTMKLLQSGTRLFSCETERREDLPLSVFYLSDAGVYVAKYRRGIHSYAPGPDAF